MFWALSGLLVLTCCLLLLKTLRAQPPKDQIPENHDLRVYKDQMAELERDLQRGTLSEHEAEASRTEIARRILVADRLSEKPVKTAKSNPAFALVFCLLLGGTSFGLYFHLGAPGHKDQPLASRLQQAKEARADRPDQEAAEKQTARVSIPADPKYLALIEKLRNTVSKRPNDKQGHMLLARHEASLGNFVAARMAQSRVIELQGAKTSAGSLSDFAEYMILAADGYVSPQAEVILSQSLQIDSRLAKSRYYSGLTLAQNGRPDLAYDIWANLLAEGKADAPWWDMMQRQIGPVAAAAGITIPKQAPGPDREAMEAAQDLSPKEREDMIRAMVAQLADRLATAGGSAQEWARLIRAYGVLGETAKASEIWNEAQAVFGSRPDDIVLLKDAAQTAGVAN